MPKQVLITGGAQRLGAELVRAFAKGGWTVWCHFQRSEAAAQTLAFDLGDLGLDIHLIRADLSQPSEIEAMMASIEQKGGALDAIINNASLFEPDSGTHLAFDKARQQFDVNLIAPMYLGQLLSHQLVRAERFDACMIHVLDQKVFNLNPDYFSYTLSKLALERSVALQAQALAPRVRVCGVAPGLMYLSGPQEEENFQLASKMNLRRTATDPADVAKTCLFLASTPSITGSTVCVDNGQHLVPLPRDVMFVIDEWINKHK